VNFHDVDRKMIQAKTNSISKGNTPKYMNQGIFNKARFVDVNRKSSLIAGLTYKLVRRVAIKID